MYVCTNIRWFSSLVPWKTKKTKQHKAQTKTENNFSYSFTAAAAAAALRNREYNFCRSHFSLLMPFFIIWMRFSSFSTGVSGLKEFLASSFISFFINLWTAETEWVCAQKDIEPTIKWKSWKIFNFSTVKFLKWKQCTKTVFVNWMWCCCSWSKHREKSFKSVLFGWFFFLSRFVQFFSVANVEKRVVWTQTCRQTEWIEKKSQK